MSSVSLRALTLLQPPQQDLIERLGGDRFGDEVIHACIEALILAFDEGIRRHRQDGGGATAG